MTIPFWPFPDTRFPRGGTTKTGGTEPLLPVGLLALPVRLSTNTVPPISLASDDMPIVMPLPPLATAALTGWVRADPVGDHRVARGAGQGETIPAIGRYDVSDDTRGIRGVQADQVLVGARREGHAAAPVPEGLAAEVQPDVVVVERDRAGGDRHPVASCIVHREAEQLRPVGAGREQQAAAVLAVDLYDRRPSAGVRRRRGPVDLHVAGDRWERVGERR